MKGTSAETKRFRIELTVFMVLLYGSTSSVYLNGDDFMYGTFAHNGIFKDVWAYYFTGNGRFWINVLDSALLFFDRYLFVVLAPLVVLAFLWLLAKNLQEVLGCAEDRAKEREFMEYGMVFFACLDVLCLRETVFWITGMMNYLFPAVMFLLGYYLFRLARDGKLSGWKLGAYFFTAFLTASSVEQYALMFVGMMTLHHGWDLLKKQKIHGYQWAAYGVALVGLAALILAPGNFARVEEQQMPSFVVNLWALVYQDTMHDVALPFVVMTALIGALYSGGGRVRNIFSAAVPVVILAVSVTPLAERAVVLAGLILLWGVQMLLLLSSAGCRKHSSVYFLAFVGVGSQIMLLVSAVWGFRCMLSLYLVYMMLIAILLDELTAEQRWLVLACGGAVSLNPVIGLVAVTAATVLRCLGKNLKLGRPATGLCVLAAMALLCVGYGTNASIHRENLQETERAGAHLVLNALPQEEYSWYLVPFSDFHIDYYKQYHGLDEATELEFILPAESAN